MTSLVAVPPSVLDYITGNPVVLCGLVILCILPIVSLLTYLVPQFYVSFFAREQNFKKKYGAKWAVVTGGSSGIGLAIAHKLASQGINVCIAALDDDKLKETVAALSKKYGPKVEFRAIPCNLSSQMYMLAIRTHTSDIDVQLVFNNAGYIHPGLIGTAHLGPDAAMSNHNTNSTAALAITQHFLSLMKEKKLKGLIAFTSSCVAYIPTPMATIYGATKAYLTSFAAGLACELVDDGIDVVVVNPSPIDTDFYKNGRGLWAMKMFSKTAVSPSRVVTKIFKAAGRMVVVDQGYVPLLLKIALKIVDWNSIANVMPYLVKQLPDYKLLRKFETKEEEKRKLN